MVDVYKLTAFPNGKNGGNKAGVVLDADNLTEYNMQQIAEEVGFSETAFVLKSDQATYKVRFFTPTKEVDLCGHATIATWNLLRDKKKVKVGLHTMETKVGTLEINVKKKEVFMEQVLPKYGEAIDESELDDCFYEERFIDKSLPALVVSTGLREIFLPVINKETLHKLNPKMKHILFLCEKYNVIGIHVFALDQEVDAYGRNFAPAVGIDEESATGTSSGALSCYLNKYVSPNKTEYILRQGYSMNQPSQIKIKLEKQLTQITKVLVGGSAKLIK